MKSFRTMVVGLVCAAKTEMGGRSKEAKVKAKVKQDGRRVGSCKSRERINKLRQRRVSETF